MAKRKRKKKVQRVVIEYRFLSYDQPGYKESIDVDEWRITRTDGGFSVSKDALYLRDVRSELEIAGFSQHGAKHVRGKEHLARNIWLPLWREVWTRPTPPPPAELDTQPTGLTTNAQSVII